MLKNAAQLLIDRVIRMNNHSYQDFAQQEDIPAETITYFSLDAAIVGITLYQGVFVLVYSYDLLVDEFTKDMDRECAEEWVDYNILGAYMGPGTPVVVNGDEIITNRGGDSHSFITIEVSHLFPGATLYSLGKAYSMEDYG